MLRGAPETVGFKPADVNKDTYLIIDPSPRIRTTPGALDAAR